MITLKKKFSKINVEDKCIDLKICPACNSKKLSVVETYDYVIEKNLTTGFILKRYNTNQCTHSNLKCRGCNWCSSGEVV